MFRAEGRLRQFLYPNIKCGPQRAQCCGPHNFLELIRLPLARLENPQIERIEPHSETVALAFVVPFPSLDAIVASAMPQDAPYKIRNAVFGFLSGCAVLIAAWSLSDSSSPSAQDVTAYYESTVAPILDESARRDRAAADAAMKRLHAHFQRFHGGIPAFAEDITGWGTRFGIVGRSVKDLWTKFWEDATRATATKQYVNAKFRDHIVSEVKLNAAIADTLGVFHEAITANRNRTLAEVKLALTMPECPVQIPPLRIDALMRESAAAAEKLSAKQSGDTVISGIATLAVGAAAGEAATNLAASLLARLAATTAATIATEGSAAAGATATGGAAGTVGGPAGTIIGVGVGIVAAVIMDWWMTDSFKTKLHEQCGSFLTKLEGELAASLRKPLEDAATTNHAAFRTALQHSLP